MIQALDREAICAILVTTICLTCSYDLLCPDPSHWKLRARAKCGNITTYKCLYDDNNEYYVENCTKPDIEAAGYKLVWRGNLDRASCRKNRYQPFIFYTTETSDCSLQKSKCKGEGQLVYDLGMTSEDIQCRCNSMSGYALVHKPMHSCFCVPSIEDCTCFRKTCIEPLALSPVYDCDTTQNQSNKEDSCSSAYYEADVDDSYTYLVTISSSLLYNINSGDRTWRQIAAMVLLCLIFGAILVLVIELNTGICVEATRKSELPQSEEGKGPYFEILKSVTETRNYIRIVIIGENGVGKTCLLRRLLEESIEDVKSTDGIDIVQRCKIRLSDGKWIIDKDTNKRKDIMTRIKMAVNAKTSDKQHNQLSTSKDDKVKRISVENKMDLTELSTTSTDEKDKMKDTEPSTSHTEDKEQMEDTEPSTSNIGDKDKIEVNESSTHITDGKEKMKDTESLTPSTEDTRQGNSDALPLLENELSFSEPNQLHTAEKKSESRHETIFTEPILNELSQFMNDIEKYNILKEVLVDCGFWDFAGERQYYPTHPIFLNPNAVHLLVADITKDIKQINTEVGYDSIGEYIDFWFDSIHSCRDVEYTKDSTEEYLNPPVIVVCTGIDKCKDKLDERKNEFRKQLLSVLHNEDKRKHLRRICYISNTEPSKEDFDYLRQSIFECGKMIETCGERLPLNWIRLEHALDIVCGACVNILSWPDMLNLAAKCSIEDEKKVDLFLKYHHKIGSIIYFESLKDYIILNPKWLADVFRCFISDKYNDDVKLSDEWKTLEDTGELKPSLIKKLFQKELKIEFDKHENHLLKVMEMFGIIVKIATLMVDGQRRIVQTYYLPCMISAKASIEQIYHEFGVRGDTCKCTRTPWLCIQFDFMPFDFFNHIFCHYIRKYSVCTEAKSGRNALYHGMGVFFYDKSRKFILCFSKNTIGMQIWQWTKLEKGKCKLMLEELRSVIDTVKNKYEHRRVSYTVKTKCADGDIHIAAGRYSHDSDSELCDDKYLCEEHHVMHNTTDSFQTWFEEGSEAVVSFDYSQLYQNCIDELKSGDEKMKKEVETQKTDYEHQRTEIKTLESDLEIEKLKETVPWNIRDIAEIDRNKNQERVKTTIDLPLAIEALGFNEECNHIYKDQVIYHQNILRNTFYRKHLTNIEDNKYKIVINAGMEGRHNSIDLALDYFETSNVDQQYATVINVENDFTIIPCLNFPGYVMLKFTEGNNLITNYFFNANTGIERHAESRQIINGLTVSLAYRSWPVEASEWVSRIRPNNWPSKMLVETIMSKGFNLSPVGHYDSSEKEFQWRIGIPGEHELISNLNETQKLCFDALRLILKEDIRLINEDVLSSYHIKNVVFWCAEQESCQWTKENFAICLQTCIIRLIKCIRLGCLPHYFIKNRNLFNSKMTCDLKELIIMALTKYRIDVAAILHLRSFDELKKKTDLKVELLKCEKQKVIIKICIMFYSGSLVPFYEYPNILWGTYEGHNTITNLQNIQYILSCLRNERRHFNRPYIAFAKNMLGLLYYSRYNETGDHNDNLKAMELLSSSLTFKNSALEFRVASFYFMRHEFDDCLKVCDTFLKKKKYKSHDEKWMRASMIASDIISLIESTDVTKLTKLKEKMLAIFHDECISENCGDGRLLQAENVLSQIRILHKRSESDAKTRSDISDHFGDRTSHEALLLLFENFTNLVFCDMNLNVPYLAAEKWALPKVLLYELLSVSRCHPGSRIYGIYMDPMLNYLVLKFLCSQETMFFRQMDEILTQMKIYVTNYNELSGNRHGFSAELAHSLPLYQVYNIVAYCCVKTRRYQMALNYIMKSHQLHPIRENTAYGYIRCVCGILNSFYT